jgi:hypothetical protein
MIGWRGAIAMIMFVLLAFTLYPRANASQYTIQQSGDNFKVTWEINAWQNITSFPTSSVYPEKLNYSLTSGDLQSLTNALQSAIQARVSTAQITQPNVRIISSNSTGTNCSPICPRQWLNVTVDFQVKEVPSVNNNLASYDLSWKAIRLGDDLKVAGVSYNQIGSRYLASALAPIINTRPGPGRTIAVAVGTTIVSGLTLQALTTNLVLLDMSPLNIPLENWTYSRDIISQSQTWASPVNGGFKSQVDLRISEPGSTVDFVYSADAQVSGVVTAPLNTYARGDTLYSETSGGVYETIAFSVILATLAVLIGTVILDWRLPNAPRYQRKSKSTRR